MKCCNSTSAPPFIYGRCKCQYKLRQTCYIHYIAQLSSVRIGLALSHDKIIISYLDWLQCLDNFDFIQPLHACITCCGGAKVHNALCVLHTV